MSEIKKIVARMKRKLGLVKESLTDEMLTEIDRLGLSREFFEWVVKEEGLDFAKYGLNAQSREAALFEKWFPRAIAFAAQCREENPFPAADDLDFRDRASLSILCDKVRHAEHVPCNGNFKAAFFSAPLHVLPYVMGEWPSSYKHPIFLTPTELEQWQAIYDKEEQDKDSWWFVFQDWSAEWNPDKDSFWLKHDEFAANDGSTPLLIVHGLCWGSLAGGHRGEIWAVDDQGAARMLKATFDITY